WAMSLPRSSSSARRAGTIAASRWPGRSGTQPLRTRRLHGRPRPSARPREAASRSPRHRTDPGYRHPTVARPHRLTDLDRYRLAALPLGEEVVVADPLVVLGQFGQVVLGCLFRHRFIRLLSVRSTSQAVTTYQLLRGLDVASAR